MSALEWAIAARFVDYVSGMPDGSIECSGGAIRAADGVFRFPGDGLHFEGRVRFTAHGGMLDVTIADPRIDIEGDGFTLSIADPDSEGRMMLATGSLAAEGHLGTPRLTLDGSDLFFARYPEGSELDPFGVS